MKSYRDLEVYQQAYDLAIEVHHMTLTLPKYEMYENGGLKDLLDKYDKLGKQLNKFIQYVESSWK